MLRMPKYVVAINDNFKSSLNYYARWNRVEYEVNDLQ